MLVESVLAEVLEETDGEAIPESYWSVKEIEDGDPGEPQLELRGAVLVRVKGRQPTADAELPVRSTEPRERPDRSRLSPELAAALDQPAVRPIRELFGQLVADGLLTPLALMGALAVAAAITVAELLFFRGLLDIGAKPVLPEQRATAAVALGLFLIAALVLEAPTLAGVLRLGRRLEVRLRLRFLDKIARLPDRYFRSRLASDMAERCHSTHLLREVPGLGATLLRLFFQMVLAAAGIIWLDPGVAFLALAALVVAIAVPLIAQPALAETDLRVRNHAGALSRFSLDALLGLVPARNHGAERVMRSEHEGLLLEWHRSVLRNERAKLWVEGVQLVIGYGLAILLVFRHLAASEGIGHVLLLAYWALSLSYLGEQLTMAGRKIPPLPQRHPESAGAPGDAR